MWSRLARTRYAIRTSLRRWRARRRLHRLLGCPTDAIESLRLYFTDKQIYRASGYLRRTADYRLKTPEYFFWSEIYREI